MSSDPVEEHRLRVERNVRDLVQDKELRKRSLAWMCEAGQHEYSYNFRWLGRPIIQYPQDLMALQEILWEYKPDLVIETGIAHGGSLIFHASILELIGGDGRVVGIDIDIRKHNRAEIEAHRMFKRITLIEGPSTEEATVSKVRELAKGKGSVMVILDSNHTRDHVLKELEVYSPLVTKGNYLVVFDTSIEDTPDGYYDGKPVPWRKGNNPKTAVHDFLRKNDRFVIDEGIESKLLVTACPDGYLRCVKG
jgi:cephalosporin hydroxylase